MGRPLGDGGRRGVGVASCQCFRLTVPESSGLRSPSSKLLSHASAIQSPPCLPGTLGRWPLRPGAAPWEKVLGSHRSPVCCHGSLRLFAHTPQV